MRRPYLAMDAEISDCGLYRYWLSRRLSMGERTVTFIGLNPSTADAGVDDPTIRRCVGYARAWGFDWLFMGNLNAFRSTDPKGLPSDPLAAVGPRNQEALTFLRQRSELVIAAWGATPLNPYAAALGDMILGYPATRVLRLTKRTRKPEHPLYLPKTLVPTQYEVIK